MNYVDHPFAKQYYRFAMRYRRLGQTDCAVGEITDT